MEKKIIYTDNAPAPIGPYSQAVSVGDTVYVSGQIPVNASSGELVSDGIEAETMQVMENIQAILTAAGLTFDHVVKCSIFVTDMADFPVVNTTYEKFFSSAPPARETVQVAALPKGVHVEISCIAVKG